MASHKEWCWEVVPMWHHAASQNPRTQSQSLAHWHNAGIPMGSLSTLQDIFQIAGEENWNLMTVIDPPHGQRFMPSLTRRYQSSWCSGKQLLPSEGPKRGSQELRAELWITGLQNMHNLSVSTVVQYGIKLHDDNKGTHKQGQCSTQHSLGQGITPPPACLYTIGTMFWRGLCLTCHLLPWAIPGKEQPSGNSCMISFIIFTIIWSWPVTG
jgi:hypothetical protein